MRSCTACELPVCPTGFVVRIGATCLLQATSILQAALCLCCGCGCVGVCVLKGLLNALIKQLTMLLAVAGCSWFIELVSFSFKVHAAFCTGSTMNQECLVDWEFQPIAGILGCNGRFGAYGLFWLCCISIVQGRSYSHRFSSDFLLGRWSFQI